MLDIKTPAIITFIPGSNTSVGRRIADVAQDVVAQIVESIKIDRRFAIRIDEFVDVSDEAELLIYVRYFDVWKGAIVDEILGFKQVPEHTRGDDIFKILNNFITVELRLE